MFSQVSSVRKRSNFGTILKVFNCHLSPSSRIRCFKGRGTNYPLIWNPCIADFVVDLSHGKYGKKEDTALQDGAMAALLHLDIERDEIQMRLGGVVWNLWENVIIIIVPSYPINIIQYHHWVIFDGYLPSKLIITIPMKTAVLGISNVWTNQRQLQSSGSCRTERRRKTRRRRRRLRRCLGVKRRERYWCVSLYLRVSLYRFTIDIWI